MAVAIPATLSGLARALVQQDLLREAEAERIAAEGKPETGGFVGQLISTGRMSARDIAVFASRTFGYPLLDLNAYSAEHLASDAIDRRVMQNHQVVALLRRGNRLSVAVADPTNLRALDEIRFQTGMAVDPVVVEADKLTPILARLAEKPETSLKNLVDDDLNLEFDDGSAAEAAAAEAASIEVDDAPVVKFIQKILHDAIAEGASDIHFEPYEKFYRIRFRVDGILREVAQPPLVIKEKIASRIKVISRLNIAEKRVPQDGRMKLVLSKTKTIDFRVSSLPTLHGEKIVLRILDSSSAMLGIDALGYEPDQREELLKAIHRPYGMVLVTGPTGSGKTVSLYTCLNILNQPGTNISTAEDPAEINLAGVNQVNVDDKAGLTFAAALKSFLRQDPDIIMVGEIRDLETAEISVKAAQTGHLVLSTLHTNDAPQTLTRLMNMGVPTFNIASSIILITAQRLARKLCTCKVAIDVPMETLLNAGFTEEDLDGSWKLYGPGKCDRCKGSGYKGRIGIYQVMPVSEEIQRIIMANGTSLDIAAQAEAEGVRDLRRSGLLKVKQGVTSLDEVLATTNE
ncbi:MAG: type IV-A pilus assembly ATPase PilB [Gammaproteobacteria bacterium]|nr:type IV-A pilus assembly ATPase PilB [Gammaproteobacteria bacterium]MBU1414760.1 type IV-A pilus assembly ATPase PilB [Gammaproteobacteria bacterium]